MAKLYWTLAPLGSGFGACVAQAPRSHDNPDTWIVVQLTDPNQLDGLRDNPKPLPPYLPVNKVLSSLSTSDKPRRVAFRLL